MVVSVRVREIFWGLESLGVWAALVSRRWSLQGVLSVWGSEWNLELNRGKENGREHRKNPTDGPANK